MHSWVFLRSGTLLLLFLAAFPFLLLGAAALVTSIFLHFRQLKMAVLLFGQKSAHSVCTHRSHSSHMIHSFPSSLKSKYICLQQRQKDYFSYCRRQSGHSPQRLFQWERLCLLGLQAGQILLLQTFGLARGCSGDLCSLEEGEELGSGSLADYPLSFSIYSEMRALKFIDRNNINGDIQKHSNDIMNLAGFRVRFGRYNIWMIVLERLQSLALACAVTRPLYAFSSAKQSIDRLSDAGQQAVWAHQIIKFIKNDDSYPLNQADPTILDKIKGLNVPKTTIFESAFKIIDGRYVNKDEVLNMMTEGIVLNPIVFAQNNVEYAKQKSLFDNVASCIKNTGNFIFYPSYLGTSLVFDMLDEKIPSNFLLVGGFGISKTISIIFYIQLSNFITNYAFKCSKDPSLRKELELLKQENLLTQPFLKYFYWSADYNPALNSVQQVVVEQAVELQENDRQQLLSAKEWPDFRTRLRQVYPNNIQIRPIVDHFHLIASQIRRWNSYISTYNINQKKEFSQTIKKEFQIQKQKRYLYAKQKSIDFQLFIRLSSSYGLISSSGVERDLLKQKDNFLGKYINGKIQLQLKWLKMYRMEYDRLLETERGNVDAWNILWFEIQRRLEKSTPQDIADLRQKWIEETKDKRVSNFFRFAYLRTYLNIVEQVLKLDGQNLSISAQQMKQIAQGYLNYCFQTEEELFHKMIDKIQPWCKDAVLLMHEYAQICTQNQELRDQPALFHLSIFNMTAVTQKIDIVKQFRKIIANQIEQPPSFYLQNGYLKLNMTFFQFYQLATHFLYSSNSSSLFRENFKFSKALFSKRKARECALQAAIIAALTPGSILRYYHQADSIQQLKIAGRVGFIPLTIDQGIQDKEMFKRHFGNLLTACFNSPDSNFLATPQYAENGVMGTSQTSLDIDFAIGKYQSKDQKYLIRTFDTTVDEDPSEKVQQFSTILFPLLSKLAKEGGYTSKDIEFQHVVPSLKRTCKTAFGDPQNGFTPTIVETNVSKLTIEKSADEQALKALELTLLNCSKILTERRMIEQLARATK